MECKKLYETLTSTLVHIFFQNEANSEIFLKDLDEVLKTSNFRSEFLLEVVFAPGKTAKASFWFQSKGKRKLRDIPLESTEPTKLTNSLLSALKPLSFILSESCSPDKITRVEKRRFLGRLQSLTKLFMPTSRLNRQSTFMHTFNDFLLGIET